MTTKLIFADGTEVTSGIMSFSLTRSVSTGQELEPGACCAAMAQIRIFGPDRLPEGPVQILRMDRTQTVDLGEFYPEKPEKSGHLWVLTAYDRLIKLDRDVSLWLSRQTFPMTIYDLAKGVCAQCDLELMNESLPSGDYPVESFSIPGCTGRQVLQWMGALCGGFWEAQGAGIAMSWFTAKNIAITPGGSNYYYQGSLSMASYNVPAIDKVQVRRTSTDVGVVWPNVTAQAGYICTGNPLYSKPDQQLAQNLFQCIGGLSYTPCQVTVAEQDIRPGDIITVDGRTVAVMTTKLQNGRLTLEATGSANRESPSALNQVSFKGLNGAVLELNARVEGLQVENRDAQGHLARLELSVEGLQTKVSGDGSENDRRLTALEQTAQQLQVRIEQGVGEVTTSTGYTFGADGLTVARAGTQMSNRLDHTGMFVERAGKVILEASAKGVRAVDVQVENYLHIGSARFEDYGNRTACYYVE